MVRLLGTKVDPATGRGDRQRKTGPAKAQALRRPEQAPALRLLPRGMSTERDTVYGLLPKEWGNLFTVGRLDYDSEGLIFLTNDGELAS